MKTFKIKLNYKALIAWPVIVLLLFSMGSCNKDLLDEKPLSSLNSDLVLTSKVGYENYLTALVLSARDELTAGDTYYSNINNSDVASSAGIEYGTYNWTTAITPSTAAVAYYWNWAYLQMIPRANTIIVYANKPESNGIWATEAEKNAVIAEARFFRAYTYNILANLYGSVPIVDNIYASPKFDFVRASRKEIYEFAKSDLEFASKWLPATVVKAREGHIVKAAADHLLSEVYISLGEYEKAIASASAVINSGLYRLMTTRFGTEKDRPGDVFSDLFRDGNQNRSSGNMESIYVWQIEESTVGGGGTIGNSNLRNWAPFLANVKDPKGVAMLITDSLGRGVGRSRLSNHSVYGIWKDNANNDMRNSIYNMRRVFYYNNPASGFFGKVIEPKTVREDTMRNIYPYSRKVEGKPLNKLTTGGRTAKDIMVMRLAETYLLRAEAYLKKGDPGSAATDLNVIRARANAKPVGAAQVDIDYILDERMRELIVEEPRKRTLIRTGKLVDRVRKYDLLETTSRTSIQNFHQFLPIPQTAIDANSGAELAQNPGY
jgi:hypothetical protein